MAPSSSSFWIVLLVVLANMLAFVSAACPEQCRCTSGDMVCSCQHVGSFVLSEIPANHFTLSISNCKEVRIHGNPFNRLSLDRVMIHDSSDVQITDINFLGVSSIRRVKFSDIANLTLESLYSLKADIFELNNVTIATLNKSVIPGVAELSEIRITDSRIGTIKTGALHFQNQRTVDIIDTSIAYAANESICVDKVETFTIRNCRIAELAQDAMNIMHVGKIVLSGNSIHTLSEGSFLVDNISEMVIQRNDFRHVSFQTFYHMQNVGKFTMSGNRFLHVERHGILFFLKVEDPTSVIESNEFLCDCQLIWLYEERGYHKFDKFFNSTCWAPEKLKGLQLNELTPLSNDQQCLRLEPIVEHSFNGKESIIEVDATMYIESAGVKLMSLPIMSIVAILICLFHLL